MGMLSFLNPHAISADNLRKLLLQSNKNNPGMLHPVEKKQIYQGSNVFTEQMFSPTTTSQIHMPTTQPSAVTTGNSTTSSSQ